MAVLLARQKILAASVEAVKGTAETLDAGDAGILVEDVRFNLSPEEVERNPLRTSLAREASIPGAQIAEITCRAELKGSGTPATAPAWDPLLLGCGFVKSEQSASVVYTPDSDDADTDTLTMAVYLGGGANTRVLKMYGARGNVSFEFNANQISYMVFTFTGIYHSVADTTQLVPTYDTTLPVAWKDASVQWNIGGAFTTACLSTLTIDMANEVTIRQDANATNGLSYAVISGRDPGGSVDPDVVLKATFDWFAHMNTPTLGTFSFDVGSAAGNKISFSAPKFQVVGMGDTDRDFVATDDVAFKLRTNTGDDDIVITHS